MILDEVRLQLISRPAAMQTLNRAAAVQTLRTWEHLSAILGMRQEAGTPDCLVMAEGGHKDAFRQLPVCGERKLMAVVSSKCPNSRK